MHSKREIREAAIQFLYCIHLEDKAPAQQTTDAFWELLLEDDFTKLTKASVKSVLHLNQGRQGRYAKLVDKSPELLAIITADPQAKKLRIALNAVLKSEGNWQALIDSMQRLFKSSDHTVSTELTQTLQDIYLLNNTLQKQRTRWTEELADHPQFKNPAESVSASINAISRVSERISMIQDPTKFPNHGDVKHLIDTAAKMSSFKEAVNEAVNLVTSNIRSIDKEINAVVENYKPERIDPVDRAIMRLSVAEILFKNDIPNPVSINEAIEISQLYGSSDSSKFINGIVDKISKNNLSK